MVAVLFDAVGEKGIEKKRAVYQTRDFGWFFGQIGTVDDQYSPLFDEMGVVSAADRGQGVMLRGMVGGLNIGVGGDYEVAVEGDEW